MKMLLTCLFMVMSSPVWAAFPTTSVLDTYTRADENPLATAGVWGAPVFEDGGGENSTFRLTSNALADDSAADLAGSGQAFRDDQNYGPGSEVYVTFSTLWTNTSSDVWLWIDGRDEAVNNDGYLLYVSYNGTNWLYRSERYDNNISTVLQGNQTGPTLATGDALGAEHAVGGNLTIYHKPSGGSWAAASGVSVVNDSTYTSGHIGLSKGHADTTSRLDDFGGGTIVVSSSTFTPHRMLLGVGQ